VPELPFQHLTAQAAPSIVDRETWLAACDDLLTREKAHTREGDAIAAARRRLPMTEIPGDVTVVGADGRMPFIDAFEGRRQLVGYFHMWHDGKPWDQQHRPRHRGDGLELRAARSDRLRPSGELGELTGGMAAGVWPARRAVPDRWPADDPMERDRPSATSFLS
jgi:Bacterial protein of unknown function (DUF899)